MNTLKIGDKVFIFIDDSVEGTIVASNPSTGSHYVMWDNGFVEGWFHYTDLTLV